MFKPCMQSIEAGLSNNLTRILWLVASIAFRSLVKAGEPFGTTGLILLTLIFKVASVAAGKVASSVVLAKNVW